MALSFNRIKFGITNIQWAGRKNVSAASLIVVRNKDLGSTMIVQKMIVYFR